MRIIKSGSAVWSCIRKCDGNFAGRTFPGCGATLELNIDDIFSDVPKGTKIVIYGAICPECGCEFRVESHLLPKPIPSVPTLSEFINGKAGGG